MIFWVLSLSVEIFISDCGLGFEHIVIQKHPQHDSTYLVNVNIDTEERCSQILTKTDSNHEKSEVKVVFIRNGFHTTLLHKTRKTARLFGIESPPKNGLC